MSELKPAHTTIGMFDQSISLDIWADKYRWGDERTPFDSMERVCTGVYPKQEQQYRRQKALAYMRAGLWCPAGRIHAGAGTPKVVTLINCYVSQTIEDSMGPIGDRLKEAMLTMQQGGGIGMNFSTLRPSGAHLQRTGSEASGPLPFMHMWNSMCETIMSAGSRRGAMMATMHCEHPDLLQFIDAKHTAGKLTNFNVSVLITDAFMSAVANDEMWYLGFNVPPSKGNHLFVIDREDVDGGQWWVYSEHKARDLWNRIIKSTYEYAEPGVIFIDKVNDENNLNYVEVLQCTNPCGEQPLPPYGACNLGAVNLARMVRNPFTDEADFDFQMLRDTVAVGVDFLDHVIDVTNYPLPEQAEEQRLKRRIGLGVTGLANAMAMLGITYGSQESVWFADKVMHEVKNMAYAESSRLASEFGCFPLYEKEEYTKGKNKVLRSLDDSVVEMIEADGLRNGVLLTIAPTGTTSIYYGNVSSGVEPVFAHVIQRKVRQPDDSFKQYRVLDYAVALWQKMYPGTELPDHMVTTADIDVDAHLRIQAACQAHVDSSISKTINCPEDISFEDFKQVYFSAYEMGCKGCTTYRPSDVRGSILEADGAAPRKGSEEKQALVERPQMLQGTTYKIRWPSVDAAFYVTINEMGGVPFEVFIASKNQQYTEWTTALSLLITSLMRQGIDIKFIPEELQSIVSVSDTNWISGKFYGSLVALIGDTIGKHLESRYGAQGTQEPPQVEVPQIPPSTEDVPVDLEGASKCPRCGMKSFIMQEGCNQCVICDFSTCA